MTTHRIDEPIALVLHSLGAVRHIRRPRSQKGVAYCGELMAKNFVSNDGIEIVIPDPSNVQLEIDLERDFDGLCRDCARTFSQAVPAVRPVPQAWALIHARTGRHSPPLELEHSIDFDRLERARQAGREAACHERKEADRD